MTAPVISLRGPFHPGVQKIPADISFSKCFFRHRYNNARPHYLWSTNAWEMHFSLLLQLKYMNQFPLLHLYWLKGRAAVPWSHCHGALTPSCHSNNNNFFPDACCTLELPRWAWSDPPHSCSVPYWPLSSPSIPQNYTSPLFCTFLPPFSPLLLFLQAPHYPLSVFLTHIPDPNHCLFNVISFFLLPRHLRLPFANLNIFFDPNEAPHSMPIKDQLNGPEFVSDRLINIRLCPVYVCTVLFKCCSSAVSITY